MDMDNIIGLIIIIIVVVVIRYSVSMLPCCTRASLMRTARMIDH